MAPEFQCLALLVFTGCLVSLTVIMGHLLYGRNQ